MPFLRILAIPSSNIKKEFMFDHLRYKSKKIDITPDFPCRLTGMEIKDANTGVHSNLEVNAMIFSDGIKDIFIISFDTLFISNELKLTVTEHINHHFGQKEERDILISATHTHYAPSLERERIKLGPKDERYYEYLLAKLVTLFEELSHEPLQEVELNIAEGKSHGLTCNRRRRARTIGNYFKPIITMEPNPRGFVDEKFKIVNIRKVEDQELVGAIWSFPCHPTNFPDTALITSEFPGEIRKSIRKKHNVDSSIIYMPGFAGDVRASPPRRVSLSKSIRKILQLSYPVSYYRFKNIDEYGKWSNALIDAFWKANSDHQKIDFENSKIETAIIKESLSKLGIKVKGIENVLFRKVSIGNDFAFYTISAEPVGYYSKIFEANTKEKFVISTGYTDEVFGYLPVGRQVLEGGYESKGFFDLFLVKGAFFETTEKIVLSNLKKLDQ